MSLLNNLNSLGYSVITGAVMPSVAEDCRELDWETLERRIRAAAFDDDGYELASATPWYIELGWEQTPEGAAVWAAQYERPAKPWMPKELKWETHNNSKSKQKWRRIGKM